MDDERSFGVIDVVLLHIEDARVRCEQATRELAELGSDPRLGAATASAALGLAKVARELRNSTFFAPPQR